MLYMFKKLNIFAKAVGMGRWLKCLRKALRFRFVQSMPVKMLSSIICCIAGMVNSEVHNVAVPWVHMVKVA